MGEIFEDYGATLVNFDRLSLKSTFKNIPAADKAQISNDLFSPTFHLFMKTLATYLPLVILLFLPWDFTALHAQNAGSEKKVVITRRSVDADGTERTETIIKKGQAAQNFDAEKYLRDNRSDNVKIEVRIEDGNDNSRDNSGYNDDDDDDDSWSNSNSNNNCNNTFKSKSWSSNNYNGDGRAFLGVSEDSDEKASEKGLVVQITRGSAAEAAGLRHNDKIMSLDGVATNKWSDLSKFVSNHKPGDKVKVVYARNGREATTEATLTRSDAIKCNSQSEYNGYLGVSEEYEYEGENNKLGVQVSVSDNTAAAKAGLEDGDVITALDETPIYDFEDISDFMAYTKGGDNVKVTYERDGQRKTVNAVIGQQKNWNLDSWSQNLSDKLDNINMDFQTKEKEACLGVYTNGKGNGKSRGAGITSFTSVSAAEEAQMEVGDVILSINNARVTDSDDLWNEIAKFNPDDKVSIAYLRDGKEQNIEISLKACREKSTKVEMKASDDEGNTSERSFSITGWNKNDAQKMQERDVITIRKGTEGADAPRINTAPGNNTATDRQLTLGNFRSYPNPSSGRITVEFNGDAVPTAVAFYDLSGRQLFREEMNAFDGNYYQQFDLTDFAKGTIVVQVQQGDKVFTEQLILN